MHVEREKPTCVLKIDQSAENFRRQRWPPQERPSSHRYIVTGNQKFFGQPPVSSYAYDVQSAKDVCFHGCVALVPVTGVDILSKAVQGLFLLR